ncbi:Kinesin-like protein 6 [Cyphellophora attinorum]|uniref:Kinesin-like protein n=1 Tax=Cyphellophora attinorum TaxID=1664694 RepID=A0A0N1H5G4_9EURO|nr:Kinesin-like protein 6 [Phialophora attinorum]KPI37624.1 Kinesin-like protein 6 [Phialophora attinorum]
MGPVDAGASSISVAIRVRPFTIREAAQLTKCDDSTLFLGDGSLAAAPTPKLSQKGIRSIIKVVDDKCLVFDPPEDNPVQKFSRSVVPMGKRVKDQTFGFDRIFDENATQNDVYEATTRSLISNVFDGYNATVFAYGATGCGKTHTITGTAQQPGIIFLTMQDLFERVNELSDEKVTEISLSYLEIYNETIRDLLSPDGSKSGLMLREDSQQAVSVAGLSSHRPQNVQEVMDMIVRGNELRTMSPTEANAVSSRSHAVLQINVAQKDRNANVDEAHTMATLSIIDLAGSERASATKNRGVRLLEGANINKSLLALGSCINALCDPRRKGHVPYRNSKLTRLLKFSLGGNCKTVMIVCVSPSSQHFDETQNTLRYANRAKNIQTKVTRNVYNVNRHVKDYLVKIDEQMALINELKAQQKDHEAVAFSKFRKQSERKDNIVREGILRIRSAYDNTATERKDRITNMVKLRQIGRRIAMLSSWIAAFDHVCDNVEGDNALKNMHTVRKAAQGIMIELESGRNHCQQKVTKSNWDRPLNTALSASLDQLREVDTIDHMDSENLNREVELLKANAEHQDKLGEASTMQVLVQAHFEIIAAIDKLNAMTTDEAVEVAPKFINNMLSSATKAASYVVKPDGSIAPVETFAPRKGGTPKRRKQAVNTSILESPSIARQIPVMEVPAPKGVTFQTTPKKRKATVKRAVRWKDDTEDGALAEFEKTPQHIPSSSPPEESTAELTVPQISDLTSSFSALNTIGDDNSSPIPPSPEASFAQPTSNRFKAGFLSKKASEVSPLSASMPPPPTTTIFSSSSDSDSSPLRELDPQPNRRSLTPLTATNGNKNSPPPPSLGDLPSSDPSRPSSSDTETTIPAAQQPSRLARFAAQAASAHRLTMPREPTVDALRLLRPHPAMTICSELVMLDAWLATRAQVEDLAMTGPRTACLVRVSAGL